MADTATAVSAEDAALIAQGAALDAASASPAVDAAGKPMPAVVDFSSEAAELVALVCDTAEALFVASGLQFSAPTRAKLAAGWAPVLEKYKLTGSKIFGQYSAEIGAAIVTVPVLLAARKVVMASKQKPMAPDLAPNDLTFGRSDGNAQN